jgi:hypothetical protein
MNQLLFLLRSSIWNHLYVHTHSPPSIGTIIGIPTYPTPDVYTVKFKDGSISEYTADLLSAARISSISPSSSFLLLAWIKGGALATLFLNDMSKPRHGRLQLSEQDEWHFYPGKSTTGIFLPDLMANCQHILDSTQLFRGHTKFKNVYDARTQHGHRDCVLHHVSAHGLHSLVAPTSLKAHKNMDPNDKSIWDAA